MFEGGFISLDTCVAAGDKSTSKLKSTWYKADIEPCLGTSLYLEVPVMGEKSMARRVTSKRGLGRPDGGLQMKRQHSTALTHNKHTKKTLILNPPTTKP